MREGQIEPRPAHGVKSTLNPILSEAAKLVKHRADKLAGETVTMKVGKVVILLCIPMLSSEMAKASELWTCHGSSAQFSPMELELDGDWFVRNGENFVIGRDGQPTPIPTHEKFRILQNNAFGIIAAWSESLPDRSGKPQLGAEVIVISKPSGDTRISSAMPNGAHDLMVGHCEPRSNKLP